MNYKYISIILILIIASYIGATLLSWLVEQEAQRVNFMGWLNQLQQKAYNKGVVDVFDTVKQNGLLKIGDTTLILQ